MPSISPTHGLVLGVAHLPHATHEELGVVPDEVVDRVGRQRAVRRRQQRLDHPVGGGAFSMLARYKASTARAIDS